MNTEVDTRSRQQRRFEERNELKRKREDDEAKEAWESQICYPWMDLMNSQRIKHPISASRL